ncbi:MAG TPA: hypothetical protein VGI79_17175 [Caulobacteraceae bacterium]|jgi:hypothetical protein
MNSTRYAARYSGSRVLPFAPPGRGYASGTCHSCGQPSCDCRCGSRQCRKEAKELSFTPDAKTVGRGNVPPGGLVGNQLNTSAAADGTTTTTTGATAFVGGGCCVHISLEYAPITATAQSLVAILAKDTEGTVLAWEKADPPGTHYQVKENVITVKPGATITLIAVNATVRARWCEVFSC